MPVLFAALTALTVACGSPPSIPDGQERGPCYGNGTCDQGLSCLSQVCVQNIGFDAGTGDAAISGSGDASIQGTCPSSGVVVVVNASQTAMRVTEGQMVSLSLLACSNLPGVDVTYSWHLRNAPMSVLGTASTLEYLTSEEQGGSILEFVGVAMLDLNNTAEHSFLVEVDNNNYATAVARYVSGVPLGLRDVSSISAGASLVFLGINDGALSLAPGYIDVIDISVRAQPRSTQLIPTMNNPELAFDGAHLLVTGCRDRNTFLTIYDVSAGRLSQLSEIMIDGQGCTTQGLTLDGNIAFVQSGHDLFIYDVTNARVPALLSSSPLGVDSGGLVSWRGYYYTAGASQASPPSTELRQWDVRNPSVPRRVTSIELRPQYGFVRLYRNSGRLLALMNYNVALFDIDNPPQIRNIGQFMRYYPTVGVMVNDLLVGGWAPGLVFNELSGASSLVRRGDFDLEGREVNALTTLAWVYYKLGNFPEAVKWLDLAHKSRNDVHPVILDHLGDAHYRMGNVEEARKNWSMAMDMLMQRKRNAQEVEPIFESQELVELEKVLPAKIQALTNKQKPKVAPLGPGVPDKLAPPAPGMAPAPGIAPANPPGPRPAPR
jgi:hypothetical protein